MEYGNSVKQLHNVIMATDITNSVWNQQFMCKTASELMLTPPAAICRQAIHILCFPFKCDFAHCLSRMAALHSNQFLSVMTDVGGWGQRDADWLDGNEEDG